MKNLLTITDSAEKTKLVGQQLASEFKNTSMPIFLDGELGAGKTTLLQGLGQFLDIKSPIVSPSFQLIRKYNSQDILKLIHIDLYRLSTVPEILSIGWDELMAENAVIAVEWASRAKGILPDDAIFINIRYRSKTEREIEIARTKKNISWY